MLILLTPQSPLNPPKEAYSHVIFGFLPPLGGWGYIRYKFFNAALT